MQNRRDFLKTAALAALGSGLVVRQTLAGESLPYNIEVVKADSVLTNTPLPGRK